MQINNDQTLRHKIETINLLLTNQLSPINNPSILSNSPSMNTQHNALINELILSAANDELDSDNELSTSSNRNSKELRTSTNESKINYDQVEMLLIDLRKYIANTVNNWNTRMAEFFKKTKFDDVYISFLLK